MAKKDKDATVLYKSPEGKKLLKEAGINPEKWPEYRRLKNWEPGYKDLKDRLISGKVPEIKVTKSELEKIRKAFEDSKKFNDPEFRKKILDNLGEDADVKGILEEDENYPPSYQKLYNKYKDLSLRELLEQPDFLEHFLKSESERMKLDLPYLKEKARKEAEEIDLRNIPEEERESYLKKKEAEILRDLKKNYNSGLLSPGQLTFFSNEGEDTYDMPEDEKGLNKLAKDVETYENWIKENTVPAFDSIEDINAYLDEHYPEEEPKEQLENLAENEPEVAIENKDIIPNTAKEAEQVVDSNPHNDEANNEEIKKDVGEFIKHENGLLGKKEEPPTPKFEDGLLKRDEEQQKEFDRVREESAREAEEWRQQQFDKFANRKSEEVANVSTEPQIGEQPAEDLTFDENAYNAELERLSGSKKKGGKKRLSDLDINPLEDLEFNPEEFNKQYAIDHPEQKIHDELSDDEKNDIDYKPSKEEQEALNEANRAEWEANGRPKNKDLLDWNTQPTDTQVEEAIESNPSKAEQVAEDTLGEGNPIEEEAEQANDPTITQDDEVNNDAIESASDEDKSEFLNQMETGAPDVVDYGLEYQNGYNDPLSDATLAGIEQQAQQNNLNEIQQQLDTTIAENNNNNDYMRVRQYTPQEIEKLLAPLNKELESRRKAVADAEDAAELAQMHFDEMPNSTNDVALKKANRNLEDAQYLLDKKQKEYESAYEAAASGLNEEAKEEEPIEEEKKHPLYSDTPLPKDVAGGGNFANVHATNPEPQTHHVGGGGSSRVMPSAGVGRVGSGVHASHASSSPTKANPKANVGSRMKSVSPNIQQKGASHLSVAPAHSNGNTTNNGSGITSAPIQKSGSSLAVKSYNLPNGEANNQADLFNGTNAAGGSSNQGGLRISYIANLEARIKSIPEGLAEELGFNSKYKHVEYHNTPLEECSGGQLREIESILTDLGV